MNPQMKHSKPPYSSRLKKCITKIGRPDVLVNNAVGQPAELAPAFVYLASKDSIYVTGEVIGVAGGKPLS